MKKFKLQFGAKVSPEDLKRYEESPNWKHGKFQNLEETSMSFSFWDVPKLLYKQFSNTKIRKPKAPIEILNFNKEQFLKNSDEIKFIWYGHSALLLRLNNKTILIDPMLGSNSAPIAPSPNKRFSENTLTFIDEFPEIDLLLMSHDHYDHLDYDSIEKLKSKTKLYYVALGVKRHLVKWGVDANLIFEMDWWDHKVFKEIDIHFTPSRHFSGRGISDRSKSLWGGWVLKHKNQNIWFSGDGGYGKHFKEIGKRLGPFDFAFMECGQYNEKWQMIHMFPEECVQAAIDAKVTKAMPVHWAAFTLAFHTWQEPVEGFVEHAQKKKLEFCVPLLGELVELNADFKQLKWWE